MQGCNAMLLLCAFSRALHRVNRQNDPGQQNRWAAEFAVREAFGAGARWVFACHGFSGATISHREDYKNFFRPSDLHR